MKKECVTRRGYITRYLLIFLLMLLSASVVHAQVASVPTVVIFAPVSGANLTNSNGTSGNINIVVNVSAVNTTSNISNVTVTILDSANATLNFSIATNVTLNISGNQSFNFSFSTSDSGLPGDGIRNYTIRAQVDTTIESTGLGNQSANVSNVNITIDNTAPTVVLNTPANGTNTTSTTIVFNITPSDNTYIGDLNNTYNVSCTIFSGTDKLIQTNGTLRNGNASVFTNSTMTEKVHNWNVTCTDSVGINGTSVLRELTIDPNPTVIIVSPVSGANLTNSNGTSGNINIVVNVSHVNSTFNISNVTVTILDSANVSINLSLSTNVTLNVSGNQSFNFSFDSTASGLPGDGIRNYTIRVQVDTTVESTGLGNLTANRSNVNITFDNTAPTVVITAPVNSTNQTSASVTFNITPTDNAAQAAYIGDILNTYNLSCTIFSGTDKLIQTNGTLRNGNASVFTNSTMIEKLHKWNATCTDSVGINGSSVLQDLNIDGSFPNTANVTLSSLKIDFGDLITLSCDGSDVLSNDTNATLSIEPSGLSGFRRLVNSTTNNVSTIFRDTRALGTYSVNCSITDTSGNLNSSTKKFEVIRKLSGSKLPGGLVKKSKERISNIIINKGSEVNLGQLTFEGFDRLMVEGAEASFNIKNEQYEMVIEEISEDEITVIINGKSLTVDAGEYQELDLNGDLFGDVKVTYYGTDISGRADLTLAAVEQPTKAERDEIAKEAQDTVAKAERAQTSTTVIIITVILVIIIIGYLIIRRKQ